MFLGVRDETPIFLAVKVSLKVVRKEMKKKQEKKTPSNCFGGQRPSKRLFVLKLVYVRGTMEPRTDCSLLWV